MTKEKQIIAIAELGGWKLWPIIGWTPQGTKPPFTVGSYPPLPDYLHSHDAIIPVIENLNDETFAKFQSHLCQIIAKEYNTLTHLVTFRMMFEATPSQLAEALLRATGKWEEQYDAFYS